MFEGVKQFYTILYDCQNLIRDNDGLTGESAFDEMTKLLFMKMFYEKQINESNTQKTSLFSLANIDKNNGVSYVKDFLFDTVKKQNPNLINSDDMIRLKDQTIMDIISILDDYTLMETDIDVKGSAFEIFLGKTLTSDLGQFFTPRQIVKFTVEMVEPTINSKIDKNEPYLVLDPSCGTGGFLISTFLSIKSKIKKTESHLLKRLSESQLYGMDINPILARVTKMNMFLHGDGHGGIHTHNGLLNLENNEFENKFDLIITNPPFGNKDSDKILKLFELGRDKQTQSREILFVERCIKCLKKGGELVIVLPDGILNNTQLGYVRDYFSKHMIIDAVISLPEKTFKAVGANSKTSIIFAHKKHNDKEIQKEIFLGIAREIGFERKTKLAKEISTNDLDVIYEHYKKYKKNPFRIKGDVHKLNKKPSCFLINPTLMDKRFDPTFYYSEYVFDIKSSCSVNDVAKMVRIDANLKDNIHDNFEYVEYGSVDKHSGLITKTTTHNSMTAPNRAKMRIRTGDIICAKMKDSEKNVAIIPDTLDGHVASNGFIVLRPKEPMTSEALFMLLRKPNTTNQVRWKSSGTIMPAINDTDYMKIKIPQLTQDEIKKHTKIVSDFNSNFKKYKKISAILTSFEFRYFF